MPIFAFIARLLPVALLAVGSVASLVYAQSDDSDGQKPQIGRYGEDVTEPDAEFSDAEMLLWLSDHMQNTSLEQKIRYSFVRSGTLEDGFSDEVILKVSAVNDDGSRSVDMQFFTGQRKKGANHPQNVNNVRGNPVIGMYMQGDAYEMNRLTDGSWRYFQRMIKLGFADGSVLSDVMVDYAGKKLAAKKVTVRPYASDPRQDRYPPGFGNKLYEFVLADGVPGMLYSIRTVIPAADAASTEPQLQELLQISEPK